MRSLLPCCICSTWAAVNRVAPDATAFTNRGVQFGLSIVGTWPDLLITWPMSIGCAPPMTPWHRAAA
jgi:hypothetical protein